MSQRPERPRALSTARWKRIDAVFTDVDGTLTTGGALLASTIAAVERLRRGGVRVVLVSGRPAGWGECWIRTLPVDGAIVENGGLYFARRGREVVKVYAQPQGERRTTRARLFRAVRQALGAVPGARLSMDSISTEVDLAIDYNEQVSLGPRAADVLERSLAGRGVTAVRSSVHINCWIGRFDKLITTRRFVEREWRRAFESSESRFVYVGDSLNDAPMFAGFRHSVGVANVREVLGQIATPPAFVTRADEGKGFEELARAVMRGRRTA